MLDKAEMGRAFPWKTSRGTIGPQSSDRLIEPRAEETEENPARQSSMPSAVLVLQCAVIGDVPSGGDRLILELVRRLPAEFGEVTFLTTPEGVSQLRQLGLNNLKLEVVPAF